MKKVFVFFILISLFLSGCKENDERVAQITDEKAAEEALGHFPCEAELMGYGYTSIFMADINNDGTDETYVSAFAGSGIINFFIECYDPASETVSIINERMETDYQFFEYKDNLYIAAYEYDLYFMGKPQQIYKAALRDGKLELQEISKILQKKIIDELY